MHKIEKSSPTESPLLFELDPKPAEEMLTSWGGIPLVVQASGIARQGEATRGGEGTAAGLRRGHFRRELRTVERCRGRMLGRFCTSASGPPPLGDDWPRGTFSGGGEEISVRVS